METRLYNKIINLIPSDDLKQTLKEKNFKLGEKDLLKIINDYSRTHDEKIALFDKLSFCLSNKATKRHAQKLAVFYKNQYLDFMQPTANTVYDIIIRDNAEAGDDYLEASRFITQTFDDAVKLIKSYLKCYRDVGAKDNENSRYIIYKKTTSVPTKPTDIYYNKTGILGKCILGYKFQIICIEMNNSHSEFACNRKNCINCNESCICEYEIKVPEFLEQYALVAFKAAPLHNPLKLVYGVTPAEMRDGDYCSYVLLLDNEYVKNRNGTAKDEQGYYCIYYSHEHPPYPEIFKPKREDVPDSVYSNYLYAVEVLKRIAKN